MSAGSLILTAARRASGSCCQRAGPDPQPSSGFQGQSTDIEIHAREVLDLRARTEEIYARHTRQDLERIHDDMERDRFFGAEEAVDYGLVDRVIAEHELQRRSSGFARA